MSGEAQKSLPSNVTPVIFDDRHTYERVMWVDGITPLDQTNLNKADVALDNLIGSNSGYIQQIIDTLNAEIAARQTDIPALNKLLTDAINNLEASIGSSDSQIYVTISSVRDELTQLINNLSAKLNQHITDNNEDLAELRNKLSTLESTLKTLSSKVSILEQKVENMTPGSGDIPDNVITEDDELILLCGTSRTVLH